MEVAMTRSKPTEGNDEILDKKSFVNRKKRT